MMEQLKLLAITAIAAWAQSSSVNIALRGFPASNFGSEHGPFACLGRDEIAEEEYKDFIIAMLEVCGCAGSDSSEANDL